MVEPVMFVFELARRRRSGAFRVAVHDAGLDVAEERAVGLARTFAGAPRLVHGDLHRGNVLRSVDDRAVVAIDPRPCLGDPHFDLVDRVLDAEVTCDCSLRDSAEELATAVAGVDAERTRAWATALAPVIATSMARHPGEYEQERARCLLSLAR